MEQIKTIHHYIEDVFKLRKKKEELEEKVSAVNSEISLAEVKIIEILKEAGVEKLSTKEGTVFIQQKWSVKVPYESHKKKELFEWLKTNGLFDQYATVNSMSLNSLYMKEWEDAQSDGREFSIPGIEQPTMYERLGTRKK